MWNNRFEKIKTLDSSVNRELMAIKDKELENNGIEEEIIKHDIEGLFDTKLYNSLKKSLLKITKAS